MSPDRFDMFYCGNMQCRVNTFEYGGGADGDWNDRHAGLCPGCRRPGESVS